MVTNATTSSVLADSINDMVRSARIIREYPNNVMVSLADRRTLGQGMGTSWKEVSFAQLTAQDIGETDVLDNPQPLDDSAITITPTIFGIETLLTDRMLRVISPESRAQIGSLAQNAVERLKDEKGLALFASATTTLSSAGTTLTSGHITAATSRIISNTTEPAPAGAQLVFVGHGFQMKDIQDEIVQGVNATTAPEQLLNGGLSQDVYQNMLRNGMHVGGAVMIVDGNIAIDGNDDARGGVFASGRGGAVILVQGKSPYVLTKPRPEVGGGATSFYHYDEAAWGERGAGQWLYGVLSDATAPTS